MGPSAKRQYSDIEDNDESDGDGEHILKKSKTIYDALSDLTETFKAIDEDPIDEVVHCVDLHFFERAIVMALSCGHKNQYFLQIKSNVVARPALAFICVKCDVKTLFTGTPPDKESGQVKISTKELDSFAQQIQISESLETKPAAGHIRQIKGKSENKTNNLEDSNNVKESNMEIDVIQKLTNDIQNKVLSKESDDDPVLENQPTTKHNAALEDESSTNKGDTIEDNIKIDKVKNAKLNEDLESLFCDDKIDTNNPEVEKMNEAKTTPLILIPFRDETAQDSDNESSAETSGDESSPEDQDSDGGFSDDESIPDEEISVNPKDPASDGESVRDGAISENLDHPASDDKSMPDDKISENLVDPDSDDESVPDEDIMEKMDVAEEAQKLLEEAVEENKSLQIVIDSEDVTVAEDKSLGNVTIEENKSLKNASVLEDMTVSNSDKESLPNVTSDEVKSPPNATIDQEEEEIILEDDFLNNMVSPPEVITLGEEDSLPDVTLLEHKLSPAENLSLDISMLPKQFLQNETNPPKQFLRNETIPPKQLLQNETIPPKQLLQNESVLPKKFIKLRPMKDLQENKVSASKLAEARAKFSQSISGTSSHITIPVVPSSGISSHISVPVMPSFETNRTTVAQTYNKYRTYGKSELTNPIQANTILKPFNQTIIPQPANKSFISQSLVNQTGKRFILLRRPAARQSVLKGTWHKPNENNSSVDTPISENGRATADKIISKVDTQFSKNGQTILDKAINETFQNNLSMPTLETISETSKDYDAVTSVLETIFPTPRKSRASEPSPVESELAKSSSVESRVAKSSPVESQVAKSFSAETQGTEIYTLESQLNELLKVGSQLNEPSPDKSQLNELAPVKSQKAKSSPDKSQVSKPPPPPVTLPEAESSPVKSKVTNPSPEKSKVDEFNCDTSSFISMLNTILNSDEDKESDISKQSPTKSKLPTSSPMNTQENDLAQPSSTNSENEKSTEFLYDGGMKSTKRVSKVSKNKNDAPKNIPPLHNKQTSDQLDQQSSTPSQKNSKQHAKKSLIFLPTLPKTPKSKPVSKEFQALGSIRDHDNKNGPSCFKCSKICKDAANLKNHILSHFYDVFLDILPKEKPFTCPECKKPSRDKITALRHFAFTHRKLFQLTEVTPDHFKVD